MLKACSYSASTWTFASTFVSSFAFALPLTQRFKLMLTQPQAIHVNNTLGSIYTERKPKRKDHRTMKKDQSVSDKCQRKFSLSLSASVNGPLGRIHTKRTALWSLLSLDVKCSIETYWTRGRRKHRRTVWTRHWPCRLFVCEFSHSRLVKSRGSPYWEMG